MLLLLYRGRGVKMPARRIEEDGRGQTEGDGRSLCGGRVLETVFGESAVNVL